MTSDPTYNREEIGRNLTWYIAWVLSEILNDQAPIGWSKYIYTAELLLKHFEMEPVFNRETTE